VFIYSDCCGSSGGFHRLHEKLANKWQPYAGFRLKMHANVDLIKFYASSGPADKSFADTDKGGMWSTAAFTSRTTNLNLDDNDNCNRIKA